MQPETLKAASQAFSQGRLQYHTAAGWLPAGRIPRLNEDPSLYRIVQKQPMNPTDGNPASNITKKYPRELYFQHIEAFWDGKLEQWNPFTNAWEKAFEPPNSTDCPENFRITTPKQFRPWKPEEIPLGAWIREKGVDGVSLIIAMQKGLAVRIELRFDKQSLLTSSPSYLLEHFEHSTDQGKTWLPCGVLE